MLLKSPLRGFVLTLLAALIFNQAAIFGQTRPSKYGPVSEGYFHAADNVRLFYRKVGVGKQTIVFLHGGPGLGMGDGGYDMEPLARGRTLLMYDQRGTGRSEIITDPKQLTVEYQIRDLEAFRQHFHLDRMILMGLSWGSGLAVSYAAAHPDRVEKLLLISPMPPAKTPYLEERTARINDLIGATGVARLAEIRSVLNRSSEVQAANLCREYFHLSSPPYFVNPSPFTAERAAQICDAPPAALKNRFVVVNAIVGSIGDWDFRPLLARLDIPLLVVEGEKSNVPLNATREWAAAAKKGKLFLVPNAGHVHFIEQPEQFFDVADRFLRGKRVE